LSDLTPDSAPLSGDALSEGGINGPALRAEIEKRLSGQRPTPAHRRIAQCLIDHIAEIGFLSSMELANLAKVSQPSVSRFAVALGFDGFLEMRRCFRAISASQPATTRSSEVALNKYQVAASNEVANITDLISQLSDMTAIRDFGHALAMSRPLVVLGLRASIGLAQHFAFYASKVHPDVRLIVCGGSLVDDQLEQAHAAGASVLLAFVMPLHPKETVNALQSAKQLGMKVAVVSDPGFLSHGKIADMFIGARINSNLVFDSSAASAVLISVILDAMCDAIPEEAESKLERIDKSSLKRKVFLR